MSETREIKTERQTSQQECCFCTEFRDNRTPIFIREKTDMANRIIRQTEHFIAFPSVSPLRSGHVLVCPNMHLSSLVQIPKAHIDEFITITNSVSRELEYSYGPTIVFEHGVGLGQEGGCGVSHAHLHILPLTLTDRDSLSHIVCNQYGKGMVNGFQYMASNTPRTTSYLCFGPSLCCLRQIIGLFPSQYMRRTIGAISHLQQYDWREHYGWHDFINTYDTLARPRVVMQ